MTPEALDLALAQRVADIIRKTAIEGTAVVKDPLLTGEGTYMSPMAIRKAQLLHQRWLRGLRKPIPDQKFPLEDAA